MGKQSLAHLSFMKGEYVIELTMLQVSGVAIAVVLLLLALIVVVMKSRMIEREQSLYAQQFNQQLEHLMAVEQEYKALQDTVTTLQHQAIEYQERLRQSQSIAQERDELKSSLEQVRSAKASEQSRYEAQIATLKANEQASSEKLEMLAQAEVRMQTQFENLANRIFEQKSETFAKASKHNLDGLLTPLREQIEGFKRQVNDAYVKEGQERASLKTEILSLKALNQKITEEATALTNALKGDNKQQGNWGEVVLERILEQSGLREGYEFDTQTSLRSDEGRQLQPDVIVHLPNEKDVIIDSKVSLVAYEAYHVSDDPTEQAQYIKQHVQSLRTHIKGLGKKDYQNLKGVRTLDYVLMFIPIEPAFLLAVENDPEIVSFALSNNIMLVSPTNLLVALRTINNIWQYEYQNQNAQLIAEKAGKLYDKFTGFVTDMEKLGKSLDTTSKTYDAALNKLSSGKGNLVRQVEQFKSMGVQPSKQLPKHLLSDEDTES